MPVRNEARRISRVVEALFADLAAHAGSGGGAGEWEVLIGDDHSTDGTREKLVALAGIHPLRLVLPPANLGRGAIRNALAAEARGEILVFLDGDCIPCAGFFRAWEGLEEGAAYLGRVEYERRPASGFSRYLERGSGAGKLRGPDSLPAAYFISQHFRISKSRFLEISGFRIDLSGWGGEDTDFGFKLEALGVPLRYRGQASARHSAVTSVEGYLAQLRHFGAVNLPVLERERPAIGRAFKVHLARFPLSLLLLNPVLHALLRTLVTRLRGVPWPFAFYRYVIYNSYCRGWLESGAGKRPRP